MAEVGFPQPCSCSSLSVLSLSTFLSLSSLLLSSLILYLRENQLVDSFIAVVYGRLAMVVLYGTTWCGSTHSQEVCAPHPPVPPQVLTFDARGVSGHANHQGVCQGVR